MERVDRVKYFIEILKNLSAEEFEELSLKAANENPWFTRKSVRQSIDGIIYMLDGNKIDKWLSEYHPSNSKKNVGLVMAGNIPMVGFHDLLSVFISGHNARIKLSHQDSVLMKWVVGILNEDENESIQILDKLNDFEAVIATGSSNTSRYFDYYFGKYPHIIRKNRTSLAVLTGGESDEDLHNLGEDVFSYYGLGCRNVSALRVPEGYSIERLATAWGDFSEVIQHHKFANNYDYNKSIFLVNREDHLDFGYALIKPSAELFSPISVIHYDYYSNESEIEDLKRSDEEKIQCVVGKDVNYGKAQKPELWDYADGVDTMKFLQDL